ncbi:MAG: YIP1 family protein [Pseudomonadota bacterium]
MAATRDIVATYRGPGKVMRRLLKQGAREDRALLFLMLACLLVFVAQTPRLAREAHETGADLNALMGATLMGWLFIMPLVLYLVAGLSGWIGRLVGIPISNYGARIALFWALLAATPVMLLWGLTAGFIGPGIQLQLVGAIWLTAFLWFWIACFRTAGTETG